jgi:hypothetical protein
VTAARGGEHGGRDGKATAVHNKRSTQRVHRGGNQEGREDVGKVGELTAVDDRGVELAGVYKDGSAAAKTSAGAQGRRGQTRGAPAFSSSLPGACYSSRSTRSFSSRSHLR